MVEPSAHLLQTRVPFHRLVSHVATHCGNAKLLAKFPQILLFLSLSEMKVFIKQTTKYLQEKDERRTRARMGFFFFLTVGLFGSCVFA